MPTSVITLDTDVEILEAYRSGSSDLAITAFVRRYQSFVYKSVLRYLDSTEDARDCTQEVMIKAITGLGKYRGECTLQTWIARIARNTAITMYHKRRLLRFFTIGEGTDEVDVLADQLSPADHAAQNEFEAFFRRVLSSLPIKQRETFMMRHYDDLSYEEISEIVGTSVGALKANYHWAVKKIASQLQGTDYYKQWCNE